MRRKLTTAVVFITTAGLAVACSPSKESSLTKNSEDKSLVSLPEGFTPRLPDENILGNPKDDGTCDPSIIDINHEKNTAQFTYNGQPGDNISIEMFMDDGTSNVENFELGSTNTSWQVPTNIYNGDIDYIKVSAVGRVGTPGSCHIHVD